MQTKLFVTNLSQLATASSMRQFFGVCGEVLDVEFLAERSSRPTSAAHVTMATAAAAALAVGRLHGTLLHDRSVMVSLVLGEVARSGRSSKEAEPRGVRITQQYRDRRGMFYELDCVATLLTLTFVFPEQEGLDWRVQASIIGSPKQVVEAMGATRARAFDALVQAWSEAPLEASGEIRWPEVGNALKSVRAL